MSGDGEAKLVVAIRNGDLTFVREPLLVGHYRAAQLSGTEAILNARIGGAMQDELSLDQYPSEASDAPKVFINTNSPPDDRLQPPNPEAVIVAGLGDEGTLTGTALASSVRSAVVAWSQRAVERRGRNVATFDLAATLLGSGGLGITVGQSAQLIVQGVCEANESLASLRRPMVRRLLLIELYLDRATEAWRALRAQEETTGARGAFRLDGPIEIRKGALPRPLDAGYRGATYDIVSVASDGPDGNPSVAYTVNSRRARSEVRAKGVQLNVVRQMVEDLSSDESLDEAKRGALFTLLIPPDMEPFLTSATELQLQLTPETAGIPWEMLHPVSVRNEGKTMGGRSRRPWAITTKLIRTLGIPEYRQRVIDVHGNEAALVIGEPLVTDVSYPSLPEARKEAAIVARCLAESIPVTALVAAENQRGPDGSTVLTTLLSRAWRIIHISGHGADPPPVDATPALGSAPESRGTSAGVVLSDDRFLGPNEISSLRVVPELVFLNCCHLGRTPTGEVLAPVHGRDRGRFAASVASAWIQVGVRCVVTAGWAVEDAPARIFAETFYSELANGQRFIDAVAAAREASYSPDSNTWAAYQCYGDPNWRLRSRSDDAQLPVSHADHALAEIASPSALMLALQTIAVWSAHQGASANTQRRRLTDLENRFETPWGDRGDIAEAFGDAWAEVGDREKAIGWYRRAMKAEDGRASVRALEQLGNLSARYAWESLQSDLAIADTDADRAAAFEMARQLHASGLEILDKLSGLQDTYERANLMGSAHKRLAMIEMAAGDDRQAAEAISSMLAHYSRAATIGRGKPDIDQFYSEMNVLSAEVVQDIATNTRKPIAPERITSLRATLTRRDAEAPSFWSRAGLIELTIYEALEGNELARAIDEDVLAAYRTLRDQVSAPRSWASAYDHLRFVLHAYQRIAPEAEVAAATALLRHLAPWCAA